MFINQSEEGSAYVGGDRHVEGRVEPHDVSGSSLLLLASLRCCKFQFVVVAAFVESFLVVWCRGMK